MRAYNLSASHDLTYRTTYMNRPSVTVCVAYLFRVQRFIVVCRTFIF